MKNYLNDYAMISCESLHQALELLSQPVPPIPFAGGSDLMVALNFDKLASGNYLNLQSIPELHRPIQISGNEVILSALTTYMELRMHPFFQTQFCLLKQAASLVGAPLIQTRGTWAGNIANASPAADGVPALMVYDAEVVLSSLKGQRRILLSEFYTDYKKTQRRPDELITEIRIPLNTQSHYEYYRKVGERRAQAIAKVILAGRIHINADSVVSNVRIVYGSMMPYTYRMYKLEKLLYQHAITPELIQSALYLVRKELKPIDDVRSSAHYRLQVAQNLLAEFLTQVCENYKISTAETRRVVAL